jgi:hypothetical protein
MTACGKPLRELWETVSCVPFVRYFSADTLDFTLLAGLFLSGGKLCLPHSWNHS